MNGRRSLGMAAIAAAVLAGVVLWWLATRTALPPPKVAAPNVGEAAVAPASRATLDGPRDAPAADPRMPPPLLAPTIGTDAALHPAVQLTLRQARESAAPVTADPPARLAELAAVLPFGRVPRDATGETPGRPDPMRPDPALAAATQRAVSDLQAVVESLRAADSARIDTR